MPLSFVQERQLFLELLDPHTAVNNLSICLRIRGSLDPLMLRASANRILARHEALLTGFEVEQGKPVARVAPAVEVDLGLTDLSSGQDPRAEALRLAALEARRPFDLAQAPLLRARTFRIAPDEHVMVLVVHHTIADGWSLGVFLRELFSGYRALAEGRAATPQPLPIQYADFAAWQREAMQGPLLVRQLDFWKQQLQGELPVLDLPIDRPRPVRQTFSGATHAIRLATDLTRAIKQLSRQQDVTPFMTLLAAFQTLLHRYSGLEDILVGSPTAGRTRPETQDLIGAFINTLVLRTDLSGDPAFRELLQRVRAVALAAYAHQDLPFEKLVAELRPQRDLSRTPVFQVMVNLQNAPLPSLELPGLSLQPLPLDRGAAQFDLTLMITESGETLEGVFEYNTDLFDPETIARMADSFLRLLEHAVARPETPLSRLPVMSDAERQHLLVELNDTAAEYPRTACVHELIEAQAARTPDGVAAICDGRQLTYRDLDGWANKLAKDLLDRGVGPDIRVGVYLERSLEMVVSLLAVMKAGGAYVPIDPATPPERVGFILRDASTRVLLTQTSLLPPGALQPLLVAPASEADLLTWRQRPAPRRTVGSDNLAYLIYTSGSTGQPKGVLISHNALVNLLWSMRQQLGMGPDQVLLAVTSISFDIAALELYLPLIVGGTVVVASRAQTTDRRLLQEAVARHEVDFMQATPSTWRMMLQGGWPGATGLVALCGGEPLTPGLADDLLERVGSLWNLYGPTETTVWSAACPVLRHHGPITIGRPIANTQLYILDAHLQPAPVGAIGELYIGGDGVARGYLNQPELTAGKFISRPFAGPEGADARLFRTGDRARYLRDGTIELLGRLDDQAKINGFRIELGEIEAVLGRHPGVRDVAVVVRATAAGDKHLVAYIVPAHDAPPSAAELRGYLRGVLPAYMVPAVILPLVELPLTRAGKIDRRALPAGSTGAAAASFAPPRTPLEARLAAIYADVLGVEAIGVDDNFFDVGGGSIQILEIIVRAQSEGLTLTPELFFEYQTVAELSSFLSGGGDGS